jgi:hypothetical protein
MRTWFCAQYRLRRSLRKWVRWLLRNRILPVWSHVATLNS